MGGGKLMDRQQMVTFSPSITRWEGNTSTVVFLGGAAGEHYNRGIDYSIDYWLQYWLLITSPINYYWTRLDWIDYWLLITVLMTDYSTD